MIMVFKNKKTKNRQSARVHLFHQGSSRDGSKEPGPHLEPVLHVSTGSWWANPGPEWHQSFADLDPRHAYRTSQNFGRTYTLIIQYWRRKNYEIIHMAHVELCGKQERVKKTFPILDSSK